MRLLDMFTANQIRDGDVDAFESLIDEHKSKVLTYCRRVSNDYQAAEELAQDVFLKVYTKIHGYDWTKASLSTWIYVIAHNTCLNYLRDNKTQASQEIDEGYIDPSHSPEDQYLRQENKMSLIIALNSLSAGDRELVLMKDYLGLKYREVAQIIGIPTGTVKSRLHVIRSKLKEILGDSNEHR